MKTEKILTAMKWGFFLGIVGVFILTGSPAKAQPPENWTSGIAYEVAPEAKITKVGWYIGKPQSGMTLSCEVGIINVSQKPARFKLTIYPLEGDAIAGGLYPLVERKGKPLALLPNEEMVLKWPLFGEELPKGFALVVKRMEEEKE